MERWRPLGHISQRLSQLRLQYLQLETTDSKSARLPPVPPATTTTGRKAGFQAWLLARTAEREGIQCWGIRDRQKTMLTRLWRSVRRQFKLHSQFLGHAIKGNQYYKKDPIFLTKRPKNQGAHGGACHAAG